MLHRIPQPVLVACITATLYAGACAAQPPHKLRLTYEVSYSGIVAAELTETLEHDGKSFTLTSEGRGVGIGALLYRGVAKRWCRGEISSTGLRPLEFREQRGDRPPAIARFDWNAKTLTQEHEGRSETVRMALPLQDRLSFLYDFAFQAAPDLKPGREIRITLTDGRGLTRFKYQVAGSEMLKTPAGEFDTVHLEKQRDNQEDKGTDIWFARSRDYLPVRILVTEKDGTRIDEVLARIGD